MSKETEEFKKYYQQEKVTSTYDAQREGNEYRRKKRALELQYFLELINRRDGERILELGCSSGFLTEHLGEVTAIDTSKDMLEITKKKNPKAYCIEGDMFNLQFKPYHFDKVVTIRVWNHLSPEDLSKALEQAYYVLKPGGILVFDAEEKNILRKITAKFYQALTGITGFKIYQYSLGELIELLHSKGFNIEKVRFINHRIGRQIILKCRVI